MTISESLGSISFYPIPQDVIGTACISHGINADDEATMDELNSSEYDLAKADCYKWLVYAPPSISENGTSFQISDEQRRHFRKLANEIYKRNKKPPLPTEYGRKHWNF